MISLFTDRYKLTLMLSSIFIAGVGYSLYSIYSLPTGLQLAGGFEPQFTRVYVILGGTFLLGALTLIYALRYKKEVVVFRDRALEASVGKHDADNAGKSTISLDNIIQTLNQASSETDAQQLTLQAICKELEAGQGALYRIVEEDGKRKIELKLGYALSIGESTIIKYEIGEGLIGQAGASGNTLYVDDVPDGYIKIVSGLGSASPRHLLIVPVKKNNKVLGILELASFTVVSEDQRKFVEEAGQLLADKISTTA
ncbi:MAG TPA: GAF domain-containing protein [Chryseolinea sp.]|nr:GAF domain-containing protein [Chryseolinea sp.]